MLKQVRHTIINHLWEIHRQSTPQIKLIENGLRAKGIETLYLDHFAIIDLPGPHTGIPILRDIFAAIGYEVQGNDYLADKQNDFVWMTEEDSLNTPAKAVLPQVVVADFRLEELPLSIQTIITKYAKQSSPSPIADIKKLIANFHAHNSHEILQLLNTLVMHYFRGRDWSLPTIKEFYTVHEFNELLAWVLINGRRPNHFTLSIHLLNHFNNLEHFHQFIEGLGITLNHDGGKIKGDKTVGIAQGSTIGLNNIIQLQDGYIELPGEFVEFVWRYPHDETIINPHYWNEYFTGFIAQNADHVIESLNLSDTCSV